MLTYKIEGGNIFEYDEKNIKDNQLVYNGYTNDGQVIKIIDFEKNKIRPLAQDLLDKMGIETLQTRLLKGSLVLILILFISQFILLYFYKNISGELEAIKGYTKPKETTIFSFPVNSGTGQIQKTF